MDLFSDTDIEDIYTKSEMKIPKSNEVHLSLISLKNGAQDNNCMDFDDKENDAEPDSETSYSSDNEEFEEKKLFNLK